MPTVHLTCEAVLMQQLQPGCTVARAAGALLQLEAALRRIAVNPQWDAASSQGEASSPQGTPEGSAEPPGALRPPIVAPSKHTSYLPRLSCSGFLPA